MTLVPERAPSVPTGTWEIDDHARLRPVFVLDGRRVMVRWADYGAGSDALAERLVARECLRLLVHRLGIPLRRLVPSLARGRADLPLWMLGDPGWMEIVSLAERGARGLERA